MAPRCAACASTLSGGPLLPREGQVMIFAGGIPYLYNGVVCKECGRVECSACQQRRGAPGDTPCRWCRSAVLPAYAHLIGGFGRSSPTPAAAAAKQRHTWPRWSDLLFAPFRLFLVLAVGGGLVMLLAVLPTVGLYAWLHPATSYGPLPGEAGSVYWIASTFNSTVSPYAFYAGWAGGLLVLALIALWIGPLWASINSAAKEGDSSFDLSRLEVGFHRLLAAAGFVALLPLPWLVSFTAYASRPPEVVCTLNREGMTLHGREVVPGKPPEPSSGSASTGGGGAVAVKRPDALPLPPRPVRVRPEEVRAGKAGDRVERVVAWKDVTAVWFVTMGDSQTALHWADPAGNEQRIALPAHVGFTSDANARGWVEAIERLAPQVLLLDASRKVLHMPVTDADRLLADLEGYKKRQDYDRAAWFGGRLTVRGEVRQVIDRTLQDFSEGKHRREVAVALAAGPGEDGPVVYCIFGGEVIATLSDTDRQKLDAAAALKTGTVLVIRGRRDDTSAVYNSPYRQKKPGENIHLRQCELIPDRPAQQPAR